MLQPLLEKLNTMRIILATSSKQRQDILRSTALKFEIIPSTYDESLDRNNYTVSDYVTETALEKVKDVTEKLKNDAIKPDVIIGLDTMVALNGIMYGKPKSKDDAINTISKLTNSADIPHEIYTGVVINYRGSINKFVEVTTVYMNTLTKEEIISYVDTNEPMGKAGAYAIQGLAGSFVRRIEGDYNNVIGLPLCSITQKLKELVI